MTALYKAKVEVAVQVVERWILARLRNQRFFSLEELNLRIGEELNGWVMRTYGVSRRELFERLERPALKPLPDRRFVYGEWKTARVSIDYHLEVERHYYSAPHAPVGEKLDVRVTATTVEVFQGSRRVASHARSYRQNAHTTVAEHMPKAHRDHLEWSPSRFLRWAETIGPKTRALVEAILAERPHPEQGYRSCLGILRLSKGSSQLPPTKWHEYLHDPSVADAICDRVLHNAHKIVLKGPSRRKEKPNRGQ